KPDAGPPWTLWSSDTSEQRPPSALLIPIGGRLTSARPSQLHAQHSRVFKPAPVVVPHRCDRRLGGEPFTNQRGDGRRLLRLHLGRVLRVHVQERDSLGGEPKLRVIRAVKD